MIDFAEELQRITTIPGDEVSPHASDFVVQVDVLCLGDAQAVLDRVRGLLGVVVRHRLELPPDDEVEPDPVFTVAAAYWTTVLPSWFLDRTPFASATQSSSGWTVEAWLYWFLSAHESRDWRWFSATVVSPTQIAVAIQVVDLPLAWESLRWALLTAGAMSAEL